MDKITESLKQYLNSVDIPHQTLFNSDGGLRKGYPTSTCFHRENEDNPLQRMSVLVDIYPEDHEFRITSFPMAVFDGEGMNELRAFVSKWNRIRMMTKLVVEEELGVTMINRYCFELKMFGFCDHDGLEQTMWKKYLERVENDTYDAWDEISELTDLYKC